MNYYIHVVSTSMIKKNARMLEMIAPFSRYSTTRMNTSIEHRSERKHNSTKTPARQDLDFAIGWNRVGLKMTGLWTYPDESESQTVLSHIHTAFLVLAVFFLQIIPQTVALIKVWGITGLIIDNITMYLPCTVAEFKLLVLWYKKKDLATIFSMITQDWLVKKSSRERDVMMKCARISKTLTIGGTLGSIACTNLIFFPIFFNTIIRTVNNITDTPGRLLPLQFVYFYDITPLHIYRLTVLSQFFVGAFVILLYSGVDVLFGMIIMHLCGQLENLSYELETMANHRHSFQKHLKINVQRHCTLIKFRNETENIFSAMVLALFVLFSVIFCLESFHLIRIFSNNAKLPVTQVTCYLVLINYFLFLMFVYSWVGQNLVTQSESLYTAVYNCNWTSLTPNEFRIITLILIRTHKALYITAGKFSIVTLNTYVTIVKTSCGWVSVLLAANQ